MPDAWLPYVEAVELPLTSPVRGAGRATIATAREKRFRWIWPDAPAAVIADALGAVVDPADLPDWLDVAILDRPIAVPSELASLPLLTATWAAIDARFPGREGRAELAHLLHTGSALEWVQQLGSLAAVLDLAVTLPAWLVPLGSCGRVLPPCAPATVDEAFLLAARRHLRTAALQPRYVEDDDWCRAIGARVGLAPRGRLTLQEAGAMVGVTRERMRQIETPCPMHHQLRRRWPLGEAVSHVRAALLAAIDERLDVSRRAFDALGFDSDEPHTVATTLLDAYGTSIPVHVDGGRVLRAGATPSPASGLDRKTVRDVAWEVSDRTGIVRLPELVATLERRGAGRSEHIEAVVRTALDMTDLPDDRALVIRERDMQLLAIPRRMLTWRSPLTIHQLHAGMARRMRMHRKHAPPAPDVLREILARHGDFVVILEFVALARAEPPDATTILGWITEQVQASPYGALHRATILDRARRAGFNHSTVLLYLTFGETLIPVGSGCVAVVGSRVDPAALARARRDAARHFVDSSVTAIADGSELALRCVVGTHNRVGGQIAVNRSIVDRLGPRKYRVRALGMERGSLGLSSHTLYGFASTFNALDIEPGDEIDIRFDLDDATATVTRAERVADAADDGAG